VVEEKGIKSERERMDEREGERNRNKGIMKKG